MSLLATFTRKNRNLKGRIAGYGCCLRCGDTWDWKPEHVTHYRTEGWPKEGCFPLCEECWERLTPEERWPFYDGLVDKWIADHPEQERADLYRAALGRGPYYEEKREQIRAAVMAGE